jgi:hypothetical protein
MSQILWKNGYEPGWNLSTQQKQPSVETTSQHSHLRMRIPSFVENCKRLRKQYEQAESARSVRTDTRTSKEAMRRAAKVDANQSAITKALRSAGAFVQPLHSIGQGCPDLLVAYRGKWSVLEVKDGDKPPSQRKLTPDEQEWHERVGGRAPVFIVENIEDALVAIGAVTLKD